MGRLGVQYCDVEIAIHEILKSNLTPTVDRIREVLRTGSKSTILNHLRRWRATLNNNSTQNEHSLPPELVVLIKDYFKQLKQDFSPNESTAKSEISNLKHKLQLLELNRLALLKQRQNLKAELKKLKDELSTS